MKKLLSLPPHIVNCFHQITELPEREFYATCDPVGHRLGSGGGTAWLLEQCHGSEASDVPFDEWLAKEKRILIHGGGQSRRLPAYAPSGKLLLPMPVYRWERGQRLNQNLMELQLPLFQRMMESAPDGLNTMVVSGDVLIRTDQPLQPMPEADVVCYGLWLDSEVAKNHGVFLLDRHSPGVLKRMLQKPSVRELKELQKDHFFLTDIGLWILSDKAVGVLRKRSEDGSGKKIQYDLYAQFGGAMGTDPLADDEEVAALKVVVLPLNGGEFYHFGTSREMISSTLAVQNIVNDQRRIMHNDRRPHPAIFVQNAKVDLTFSENNKNIWVENSCVNASWTLTQDNVVTGVPVNGWKLRLDPGECIDVVPVDNEMYAVRTYHIDEKFAGEEQNEKRFPLLTQELLMRYPDIDLTEVELLSAEEITQRANLKRLFEQRKAFQRENWSEIARNWNHSVFYQLDLHDAACQFEKLGIPMPEPLPESAPLMTRIHDAMFRGNGQHAFELLRQGLIEPVMKQKMLPRMSVYSDQIVWGRSPVRIDIAGGWTDTPPYCLMEGSNVVNLAIDLNGQQPLQAFIRPAEQRHIVLRSIDLGDREIVSTYEQLADFKHVGSPFSIPKAALALAGFMPQFCAERYDSLEQQLEDFGCGFEISLLSAVPKGSGLGTSSILAATVLGAISDFCDLAWDKNEICRRTLVLEQLLTTGGGWQDQFGGVLAGVKKLDTEAGFTQQPVVRWLPDNVFTQPDFRPCHLLYYTGITRTAKHILAEIVRRMFLNENAQLSLLRQMKEHTQDMYEAIQRQDFQRMGTLVRKTWAQNQQIDAGTNPEAVRAITDRIDDFCLGYKLPGAGGGGYLYMVAKDPQAASRIRQILNENPQNPRARFVDMDISANGLQISRS